MAIFEIIEGKPGQGKSLYTARLARKLVKRNKKFFDRTGLKRQIFSNIKFSKDFENEAEGYISYWSNIDEITKIKHADLLWDEVATELDSRNFANLSEELKRFLSQYRKRGVDIYANTQDFSMIDMRARLMVTRVATLSKIIGSRDPTSTKPPVKNIWGLIVIREVLEILTDDPHNKKYSMFPSFFFINKEDIEIYDTSQDIPISPPLPYRHIVRRCEHCDDPEHDCNHQRVIHQ
jgi:hypothetical protein